MTLEFTANDVKVWEWWISASESIKPQIYASLSPQDKEVFSKKVKIQDDEEGVTRSRKNYMLAFYKLINSECLYNEQTLFPVIMKKTRQMHSGEMPLPTIPSAVPSYVFTKELTDPEKAAFSEESYLANKEASQKAIQKFAERITDWYIRLGTVKESERCTHTCQEYQKRWDSLEQTYKKNL